MRGPSIDRGRQPNDPTTTRFTIQLDPEQSAQLRALAKSRGIAISALIREIISKELESLRGHG